MVGILAADEVLPAHLDGDDLGLLVGAGDTVEPPQDLEAEWDRQRPDEHAHGHDDPGQPGPPVLELGQAVARLPPAGPVHRPRQDGRRQRAECEG